MVRGGEASLFRTPRSRHASGQGRTADKPPITSSQGRIDGKPCFPRRGVYRPSLQIRPFAHASVVSIRPARIRWIVNR